MLRAPIIGYLFVCAALFGCGVQDAPENPSLPGNTQAIPANGKSDSTTPMDELVDLEEDLLVDYLDEMAEQLDFFFTIEDTPDSEGALPWIERIVVVPDWEIDSVDDFVSKLNQELDGVTVVRSQKFPAVVHLIAEALQGPDYVMEQKVDINSTGPITKWLDDLSGVVDGKLGFRRTGGMPGPLQIADYSTEVDVDAQDETVRDVLTGAVELEDYSRFIWSATPEQIPEGGTQMGVIYFGPRPEPEPPEEMHLIDYLSKMAARLDCHFSLEDAIGVNGMNICSDLILLDPDLEIDSIDDLVTKLTQDIDGVKTVRSQSDLSVVHLIVESLQGPDYAFDQMVTTQYSGPLWQLPEHLGDILDGEIVNPWQSSILLDDDEIADRTTEIKIDVQNKTVRDILTMAVPMGNRPRFLWLARPNIGPEDKQSVVYFYKRVEQD